MKDNEGRSIDYLRISVTDRCNLRCIYCMPEEGVKCLPHDKIMTYDEIMKVCRIFAKHGLKKIKITGGEPLVRKNVVGLIRELKAVPGITSVTITTNGVLLADYYDALADAGIDAITVSLDTLNRDVFREITRRDELERVMAGIEKAVRGDVKFKINCVPVLGEKKQDVLALLQYAKDVDVDVRFIEMMPIGLGKKFDFVSEDSIRTLIEEHYGPMTLCEEKRGNGPSTHYNVPGLTGKVGFISAVSHKFCDKCNRVRLTSDGYLKTCLQYENGVALKPLLEQGISEEELWNVMQEAIKSKPKAHHFEEKKHEDEDEVKGMSQIGG
ncbi:MAG: GTP 3',8-cyclase MoaA [Brotaphodocola sp.]